MIASLRGNVTLIRSYIVVEVSGVGYRIQVPTSVLEHVQTGDDIALYTHHHLREDSSELYGFLALSDVELFEQLISVSGVGPKAGLALLSQFSANELQQSITSGDTSLLTKVSGIGKKTAERLILELKGTLADAAVSGAAETAPAMADALGALEQLGYTPQEALAALKEGDTQAPVEQQIRAALGLLSN